MWVTAFGDLQTVSVSSGSRLYSEGNGLMFLCSVCKLILRATKLVDLQVGHYHHNQ